MGAEKRISILYLPEIESPISGLDLAGAQLGVGGGIRPRWPQARRVRVAILPDGNSRSPQRYDGGNANVVRMASYLARRGDVECMYLCVMSPENAARGDDFLIEMERQFLRLMLVIKRDGSLIDDGIRCTIHGDLETLRGESEAGFRVVGMAEAMCGLTAHIADARLTLIFGLMYPPTLLVDLDISLLLRSGLEEEDTFRLSGIRPHPLGVCLGTTTRWPELDVNEQRRLLKARPESVPSVRTGYLVPEVIRLVQALGVADIGPVDLTIPVAATESEVWEAFCNDRWNVGGTVQLRAGAAPIPFGRPAAGKSAPEVHLVAPSLVRAGLTAEHHAALAPGQRPPAFVLGGVPLGYATVHAASAGPAGLVEGIRKALRFREAHAALRGGLRPGSVPGAGAHADEPPWSAAVQGLIDVAYARWPLSVEELSSATGGDFAALDWHAQANVFAARQIAGAARAGMLSAKPIDERASEGGERVFDRKWQRALFNYDLTAFYAVGKHQLSSANRGSALAVAEATSAYTHLVALGDRGVFDHVYAAESPLDRRARLAESARFLATGVAGQRADLPDVRGAALLRTIHAGWLDFRACYADRCHPAALEIWQRDMVRFYQASVAEYDPEVTHDPRVRQLLLPGDGRAAPKALQEWVRAAMPPIVAQRIEEILATGGAVGEDASMQSELRAYLYLGEVSLTIGARMFFESALLAWPAAEVTEERSEVLAGVLSILDMFLRAQNDRSDLLQYPTGDRDKHKLNTATVLISRGLSDADHALAKIDAEIVCARVVSRLEGAFQTELRRLAKTWPQMAAFVQRAAYIGRGAYERHYEDLSRGEMAAIADSAERAARVSA